MGRAEDDQVGRFGAGETGEIAAVFIGDRDDQHLGVVGAGQDAAQLERVTALQPVGRGIR